MHFIRNAALDIHLKMAHVILDTSLYLIRDNAAQRVCNVSNYRTGAIITRRLLFFIPFFNSVYIVDR
jgi:hypothetical protein